jgi:hypothetical protein
MDFFFKSRKFIIEKLNRGFDILNNWDEKLKYELENLAIPYHSEPGIFTNWQNQIPTKTHPRIHLPASVGILAQYLLRFGKNEVFLQPKTHLYLQ